MYTSVYTFPNKGVYCAYCEDIGINSKRMCKFLSLHLWLSPWKKAKCIPSSGPSIKSLYDIWRVCTLITHDSEPIGLHWMLTARSHYGTDMRKVTFIAHCFTLVNFDSRHLSYAYPARLLIFIICLYVDTIIVCYYCLKEIYKLSTLYSIRTSSIRYNKVFAEL